MKHGSLFSGIGGFDLAAEWMGWENVFHSECNPFGQKVLKHHFPNSISYADITKTDFTIHRGDIDILTGGFPCQPYSSAGKRKGKDDERHLWPEMLRAIREIAPTWVVGENVYGLVNWSGGLVFHEVQANLEAEGYEVFPFLLPAVSVNAPHRRDRIWFVAYSVSASKRTNEFRGLRCQNGEISGEGIQTIHDAFRPNGNEGTSSDSNGIGRIQIKGRGIGESNEFNKISKEQNASNTNNNGCNECDCEHEINAGEGRINAFNDIEQNYFADTKSIGQKYALEDRELERRRFGNSNKRNMWDSFPSQSPICGGDDGIPRELDDITFSKWRQESIKAYGNAIVPQVALQIFKTIQQYEILHNKHNPTH